MADQPQTVHSAARWCEAMVEGVCEGIAVHTHHLRLRSQGGKNGPTILVCRACHGHIHGNPAWAYEHGLLLRTEAAS